MIQEGLFLQRYLAMSDQEDPSHPSFQGVQLQTFLVDRCLPALLLILGGQWDQQYPVSQITLEGHLSLEHHLSLGPQACPPLPLVLIALEVLVVLLLLECLEVQVTLCCPEVQEGLELQCLVLLGYPSLQEPLGVHFHPSVQLVLLFLVLLDSPVCPALLGTQASPTSHLALLFLALLDFLGSHLFHFLHWILCLPSPHEDLCSPSLL